MRPKGGLVTKHALLAGESSAGSIASTPELRNAAVRFPSISAVLGKRGKEEAERLAALQQVRCAIRILRQSDYSGYEQ